jgi:amidophosphoribosyltransferase
MAEKKRGYYFLPMTPILVERMNSMRLRTSGPSGTCSSICFTASKSDLELITRQVIRDFEGDDKANLDKYSKTDSPEYQRMVAEIGRRLGLSSVKFATLEDLIASIGLPKENVCTHCFDGSSYDQQQSGDFFG